MIERVLVHGPLFEAMIMDREQGNPTFKFLFDNTVSWSDWTTGKHAVTHHLQIAPT